MKTNELMIGDWLIPYNEIEPRKVVSLGYQYDMAGKYDCVAFEGTPHTFNYTGFCKPIPLTPEILEKNGWEKRPTGYVFYIDGKRYDNSLWYIFGSNTFVVNTAEFQIKYVHELQHALKMCGIEKEINL